MIVICFNVSSLYVFEKPVSMMKLCNEVKTMREFAYQGDRVSTGVGCEAARARCGWLMCRECAELPYGTWFLFRLIGVVCINSVWK